MHDLQGDIFQGELVRLTMEEPEELASAYGRWWQDSEYWRLMASDPARQYSKKATQEWITKHQEQEELKDIAFGIRTLADNRLVGDIGLDGILWNHGDSYVGISIGERDYWGKGYGSDAMRILIRYAFLELNLHRLTLNVFDYNPRALRSYQKVGFVEEGRVREFLRRDGKRYDLVHMGILKADWKKNHANLPSG